VAAAIPTALSTFWGLETRRDPAGPADVPWELRRESPGPELLAGLGGQAPGAAAIDALCENAPVWRAPPVSRGVGWTATRAAKAIINLWMEADIAGVCDPAKLREFLERPCLFWGADADQPGADRRLLDLFPGLARDVFGLCLDGRRLAAAAQSLPDTAEIFQMGVMGARTGAGARLCVRRLDPDATERWLGRIGWPGTPGAVAGLMWQLWPLVGRIVIDVDIVPGGTGPKLGLELYRPGDGIEPAQWQPLFDHLAESGPHMQRYSRGAAFRRDPAIGYPVIVQSLHHVKLVVTGSAPVEAKGYLGIFRPGYDYSGFVGGRAAGGRGGWILT
jgi:hypothetical protein